MISLQDLPTTLLWHFRSIDPVHLAIIALICGLLTDGMIGVLLMPAVGAAAYWVLETVLPPLVAHNTLIPTHVQMPAAEQALTLYLAFLAANTVVFALKKMVAGAVQYR
jgi:hypothetical protein